MRALLLLGVVVATACGGPIVGNGVASQDSRVMTSMGALDVTGPLSLTVGEAEGPFTVRLSGDANLLPLVHWVETPSGLVIDASGLVPSSPLRLEVTGPALQHLSVSGEVTASVQVMRGNRVELLAVDHSTLKVASLVADSAALQATESSTIDVSGEARALELTAAHLSDVLAQRVSASVAKVDAAALSTVRVRVTHEVSGSVRDGSLLRISGQPQRQLVTASGTAEIALETPNN